MRAAVLRRGAIVVDEIDDLRPGPNQVLVDTIACGICGSDLHTVDHAHPWNSTEYRPPSMLWPTPTST